MDVVAVIGGGNVAFDTARVAVKMGAEKVYILYRRDEQSMPARKVEIEDSIKDGIEIIYKIRPIELKMQNNKLQEIICIRTKVEDGIAVDIQNSVHTIKADNIIFAIGLTPNEKLLNELGIKNNNGFIITDENKMTNKDGVFAGGDAIEAKSTVARAIKSGKTVAENIEKYLKKVISL